VKYSPTAAATLLGLGVTSKNEQVKQIRVNFYSYKTSNVNSLGMADSFFNISSKFIQTLVPSSFNKFVKSAAEQATDERPIAPKYI